ncbi:MAG: hypothetical protein HOO67_06290 [Candidatus Peribacteraceae bacterium]|nr:hypothetical protein [Candidatus Peribacteraceae bacterium]
MGRNKLESTKREEKKVDLQSACRSLVDQTAQLEGLCGASLSGDYADDAPRTKALAGLHELRRDFYGKMNPQQDAQIAYIITLLNQQETQDHDNDDPKQKERQLAAAIRKKANEISEVARKL